MAAPKGNQYYKLRKDFDGDGKKKSPEDIFDGASEYIQYCLENPMKTTDFKGKDATPVIYEIPRAMTEQGVCNWIGISVETWDNYKKDKKYFGIITHVEQVMYAWNFENASAGLIKEQIISKKLNLVTKNQTDVISGGESILDAMIRNGAKVK